MKEPKLPCWWPKRATLLNFTSPGTDQALHPTCLVLVQTGARAGWRIDVQADGTLLVRVARVSVAAHRVQAQGVVDVGGAAPRPPLTAPSGNNSGQGLHEWATLSLRRALRAFKSHRPTCCVAEQQAMRAHEVEAMTPGRRGATAGSLARGAPGAEPQLLHAARQHVEPAVELAWLCTRDCCPCFQQIRLPHRAREGSRHRS